MEEQDLGRKPNTIRDWLNSHRREIEQEAERRDIGASQLVITMLEDALQAYKAGRNEND
jgi:hypothetical protein